MLQGRDIPYRQLNYGSLEDMINSISGLKVTQLNDTLTVMKATLASELVFRFLKHVQRTMQHRKRNCKKMGAAKILFSQPIIKYFILCVLAVGCFICFNILLFVFDAPNAFNVMKNNDQISTGAYPKCPGLEAPPVPSIGSIFNIHITQATDPDHFIVQPFNNVHELEALMNELSRFYENYSGSSVTLSSLKVGNVYAAKYDENGRWYRTCISKIISKTTGVVYFCDYGEYKVISLEQLRPLENHFYNLPYQAIKAKLHGITPKLKNGWTLKDSSRFSELIAAKNFVSLIKSYEVKNSSTEEIIIGLELIDTSTLEGTYVTKIFVSENRADRTE